MGKEDSLTEMVKEKTARFEKNLQKAIKISESFFAEIAKKNFRCKTVFMKIEDTNTFSSLFLVDEDDFCNDEFLAIYEESIKIRKENNTDSKFLMSIDFTPITKYLDESCLLADGYLMSYNGRIQ